MDFDKLPLLGTSGGESLKQFMAPSVTSLDTQVDAIVPAHLDYAVAEHPPVWMDLLRYDFVAVDKRHTERHHIKLPDRVLVLGREDVYDGSPCKSGMIIGKYAHIIGDKPWEGLDGIRRYNYRIPAGLFVRIYTQGSFSPLLPPKRTSISAEFPR